MNRAERIRDAAAVLARDPQEAYHTGAMEQLAKVGVPQLLAVYEAAADGFAAIEGQAISFDGDADPQYRYECEICHRGGPTRAEVEHSASCPIRSIRAALAPLRAEAE
jgi:hypothetical protein